MQYDVLVTFQIPAMMQTEGKGDDMILVITADDFIEVRPKGWQIEYLKPQDITRLPMKVAKRGLEITPYDPDPIPGPGAEANTPEAVAAWKIAAVLDILETNANSPQPKKGGLYLSRARVGT